MSEPFPTVTAYAGGGKGGEALAEVQFGLSAVCCSEQTARGGGNGERETGKALLAGAPHCSDSTATLSGYRRCPSPRDSA